MRKLLYPVALVVAFIGSQVPLYLAATDAVYTSYCDTDAWFELNKCLLDPVNAIIGSVFYFITIFVVIAVGYELAVLIKKWLR